MPSSTNVTLPRRIAPTFPHLCVVCGGMPDGTAKINTSSQNPIASFFMPILYLFGWSRIEFPIHQSCKHRFYLQRWGRTVSCWTIVIVAAYFSMPYFDGWSPLTKKLAVAGIVLLACVPYFLFELFFPRSFDVTSGNANTTYEFASNDYAVEFCDSNRAKHPNVKIKFEIG